MILGTALPLGAGSSDANSGAIGSRGVEEETAGAQSSASTNAAENSGQGVSNTGDRVDESSERAASGALASTDASKPASAAVEEGRLLEARSARAEYAFLADLEELKSELTKEFAPVEDDAGESKLDQMRVALSRLDEVVEKYEASAQVREAAAAEEKRSARIGDREEDASRVSLNEVAKQNALNGYAMAQNSLEASRSLSGGFVNATA